MAVIPDENLATIPIQLRHDTYPAYRDTSVLLRPGEVSIDSTTGNLKVGTDGALGFSGYDTLRGVSEAVILRDICCSWLKGQTPSVYGKPIATVLNDQWPLAVTLIQTSGELEVEAMSCSRPLLDKSAFGIAMNFRSYGVLHYADFLFHGIANIPNLAEFHESRGYLLTQTYAYIDVSPSGSDGEIKFLDPNSDPIESHFFFLGTKLGPYSFAVGMDIRPRYVS